MTTMPISRRPEASRSIMGQRLPERLRDSPARRTQSIVLIGRKGDELKTVYEAMSREGVDRGTERLCRRSNIDQI